MVIKESFVYKSKSDIYMYVHQCGLSVLEPWKMTTFEKVSLKPSVVSNNAVDNTGMHINKNHCKMISLLNLLTLASLPLLYYWIQLI